MGIPPSVCYPSVQVSGYYSSTSIYPCIEKATATAEEDGCTGYVVINDPNKEASVAVGSPGTIKFSWMHSTGVAGGEGFYSTPPMYVTGTQRDASANGMHLIVTYASKMTFFNLGKLANPVTGLVLANNMLAWVYNPDTGGSTRSYSLPGSSIPVNCVVRLRLRDLIKFVFSEKTIHGINDHLSEESVSLGSFNTNKWVELPNGTIFGWERNTTRKTMVKTILAMLGPQTVFNETSSGSFEIKNNTYRSGPALNKLDHLYKTDRLPIPNEIIVRYPNPIQNANHSPYETESYRLPGYSVYVPHILDAPDKDTAEELVAWWMTKMSQERESMYYKGEMDYELGLYDWVQGGSHRLFISAWPCLRWKRTFDQSSEHGENSIEIWCGLQDPRQILKLKLAASSHLSQDVFNDAVIKLVEAEEMPDYAMADDSEYALLYDDVSYGKAVYYMGEVGGDKVWGMADQSNMDAIGGIVRVSAEAGQAGEIIKVIRRGTVGIDLDGSDGSAGYIGSNGDIVTTVPAEGFGLRLLGRIKDGMFQVDIDQSWAE